MAFLALILTGTLLAYIPQYFLGNRRDLRTPMRHGLALALLYTGTDHFIHDQTRYLPMMPPQFGAASLPLVWITGAAELAGAVGLALPRTWWPRLHLPDLRRTAAILLAVLFALLVIANIHMAVQGTDVQGLEFGRTYLVVRPFLQPLFIAWALYAGGVIGARPPVR